MALMEMVGAETFSDAVKKIRRLQEASTGVSAEEASKHKVELAVELYKNKILQDENARQAQELLERKAYITELEKFKHDKELAEAFHAGKTNPQRATAAYLRHEEEDEEDEEDEEEPLPTRAQIVHKKRGSSHKESPSKRGKTGRA